MSDKILVLITGANKGIGYHAAQHLLATGKHHVIMGCRSLDNAQQAMEKLAADSEKPANKADMTPLKIDVSSDESIAAAAEEVRQKFGRLDILVNNAGIQGKQSGPILGEGNLRSAWTDCFNVNVFGHAVATEAFLPLLKESKRPEKRVVYTTSGLGSIFGALGGLNDLFYAGSLPAPVYRASKAALNMLSVTQSAQLIKDGIQVCVVDPGYTSTEFNGNSGYRTGSEGGGAVAKAITDENVNGKYISTEFKSGQLPW